MDIKDFKVGAMKNGAEYNYFLPEKINHSYVCTDEIINEIVNEQQNKKSKSQLQQTLKEDIIKRIGLTKSGHWEVRE